MFPQALTDRDHVFYREKDLCGSLLGQAHCSAYSFGIPSVGFEIVPEYIELAEKRLASIQGDPSCYPQLIMDDARRIKEYLRPASVGLCITSPPYWNILRQRRSADGKPIRNYGNEKQDIGSIEDYQQFLDSLSSVFMVFIPVSFLGLLSGQCNGHQKKEPLLSPAYGPLSGYGRYWIFIR